MTVLLTVGHGTAEAGELAALLSSASVETVVDVRTAPGSRRNPQFARAALEQWLPENGIAYRWEKDLGGFRKPRPDSVNTVLRNDAFRGYADYMRTPPFSTALDGVLHEAGSGRVAVMCSESVWWRCHRRLLSDSAVLARGAEVQHLMHDGRLMPHLVTEGARLGEDGIVVYDARQPRLA